MSLVPARRPRTPADAVVACERLCVWLATRYYADGLDRDDIIQFGRIGAWKAWRDWRAETNVPWPSFAHLCVEREIITAVKTAQRKKHHPLSEAVSFDAPVGDGRMTLAEVIPLPTADPQHRVIEREELRRLLWAVDGLSDVEQLAVAGKVAGLSYDEIAAGLEPHQLRSAQGGRKTVDNALQRAWAKLADEHCGAADATKRAPRALVYVVRREDATPRGAPTEARAVEIARARLGEEFLVARVVECTKRALSVDGFERRDTRGRPRADGRRPIAVWRVVLQGVDVPARLVA